MITDNIMELLTPGHSSNLVYNRTFKKQWEAVLVTLITSDVVDHITLTPVETRKYIHDLEGMFLAKGFGYNMLYPLIRLNGYRTSTDYTGTEKDFKVFDRGILQQYIDIFETDLRSEKENNHIT